MCGGWLDFDLSMASGGSLTFFFGWWRKDGWLAEERAAVCLARSFYYVL